MKLIPTTATSLSVNRVGPRDFALFCNPESRRAEGFSIAVARTLRQYPVLIPWQRVVEGSLWEELIAEVPLFLRLESPGRNWPVEQGLLLQGAAVTDEEVGRGWRSMPAKEARALANEPGRIWPMRQWFLGWRKVLQELSTWAEKNAPASRWLCPPEDVICMFDKAACQAELEKAGIPVPPALGIPRDFDELRALMSRAGRRRVFLKPCHGSSASGVVALEFSRTNVQAFSTIGLETGPEGLRLYNQRRIRVYRGEAEVRRLVDAVGGERCLAQVWVPKAGWEGQPFDLRVVVIGGRARQVMMRLGNGPVTNSQLLGGKGDVAQLQQHMGESAWSEMLALCERTMQVCFPRSLYAGLDVLIEPNFRTARILEVNAFGDLLPRVLHEGRSTYQWEVMEAMRR